MLSVVIIFLADDTRAYFTDPVGINDMNQANKMQANPISSDYNYLFSIDNMTLHDEEHYVLPVIDANVWWSKVTIFENVNNSQTILDEFSVLNGIQLIYNFEGDIILGEVFGNNE